MPLALGWSAVLLIGYDVLNLDVRAVRRDHHALTASCGASSRWSRYREYGANLREVRHDAAWDPVATAHRRRRFPVPRRVHAQQRRSPGHGDGARSPGRRRQPHRHGSRHRVDVLPGRRTPVARCHRGGLGGPPGAPARSLIGPAAARRPRSIGSAVGRSGARRTRLRCAGHLARGPAWRHRVRAAGARGGLAVAGSLLRAALGRPRSRALGRRAPHRRPRGARRVAAPTARRARLADSDQTAARVRTGRSRDRRMSWRARRAPERRGPRRRRGSRPRTRGLRTPRAVGGSAAPRCPRLPGLAGSPLAPDHRVAGEHRGHRAVARRTPRRGDDRGSPHRSTPRPLPRTARHQLRHGRARLDHGARPQHRSRDARGHRRKARGADAAGAHEPGPRRRHAHAAVG